MKPLGTFGCASSVPSYCGRQILSISQCGWSFFFLNCWVAVKPGFGGPVHSGRAAPRHYISESGWIRSRHVAASKSHRTCRYEHPVFAAAKRFVTGEVCFAQRWPEKSRRINDLAVGRPAALVYAGCAGRLSDRALL
jgi:hypothetical protein